MNRATMTARRFLAVRRIGYEHYIVLRELRESCKPLHDQAERASRGYHYYGVLEDGAHFISQFEKIRESLLVGDDHRLMDLIRAFKRCPMQLEQVGILINFLRALADLLAPLELPSLLDIMATEAAKEPE